MSASSCEEASPSPIARTLCPLFLAGFLAFSYNYVFMTITPSFATAQGLSIVEAGLQTSVFLGASIVLRFFFGPLADRIGTKPVMVVGMGAFVAGGAAFPACETFWQIAAARCVQAVGLAAFWSCATATVSQAAPSGKQGWWLGLYRLVTSTSLLVGPVFAFELAQRLNFDACFLVLSGCAAAALAAIMLMRPVPTAARARRAPGGLYRIVLREHGKPLTFVLGTTFVTAAGYGLLLSFAPAFISSVGGTANAGAYFTFMGVGCLAANPIAGWLADRFDQRRCLGLWMACMGAGVSCLACLPALAAAMPLSAALAGFGYAGAVTTVLSLTAAHVEEHLRSTALALQQNTVDLGIALASGVFGAAFALWGSASWLPFALQGALLAAVGLAAAATKVRG